MLKFNETDLMILARTIYGEARGELKLANGGLQSLEAVAWVVKNRTRHKRFGESIVAVCLQPWQFSCWNVNDPNRFELLHTTLENKILQTCFLSAANVLFDKVTDCTNGADHYHSIRIKPPNWGKDLVPTAQIANHIFYKLG